MLPRRLLLAAVSAVTLAAGAATTVTTASAAPPTPESAHGPSELAPKHVLPVKAAKPGGQAKPTRSTSTGISYHSGPVMTNPNGVNAYYIWYGNWSGGAVTSSNAKAVDVLTNLAGNLGGSPYFNINTTYYDAYKAPVANKVTLARSTTDNYSQQTSFGDAGVQAIVKRALDSGALPADSNGVYFVLTSGDVSETSGFLTQYCGWHTHATMNGVDIKYSFVGDPVANYAACADQTKPLNGTDSVSGDAMASIVAHELEEAVTDPDLNAWYDNRGYENADKCAWNFGTTYPVNGATANMALGSYQYLIQQNWVNAGSGGCRLSW